MTNQQKEQWCEVSGVKTKVLHATGASPEVVVYMMAYRHGSYVGRALDGVLMQKTSFPVRIVIGEDCSPDETRKVCLEYQSMFSDRISLVLPEKNTGFGYSRFLFRLCDESGAGYVAFCEGDDYWTDPLKLQKQYDFMEAHPECSGCFHDAPYVYEDGKMCRASVRPLLNGKHMLDERDVFELFGREPTCSMFFRSSVLTETPDFMFANPSDLFLALAIARNGLYAYIDETMAVHMKHSQGWSMRKPILVRKDILQRIFLLCEDEYYRSNFPDSIAGAFRRETACIKGLLNRDIDSACGSAFAAGINKLEKKVDEWQRTGARIVIYGCGKHTEYVFRNTALLRTDIVAVLDDNPSAVPFYGFEVEFSDNLPSYAGCADVVLISSTVHQQAMARNAQRQLPRGSMEVMTLYDERRLPLAAMGMAGAAVRRAAGQAFEDTKLAKRPLATGLADALEHIASMGYRPDFVIDVGVADGTPELYRAFPSARYMLIEPLCEFEPFMRSFCAGGDSVYVMAAAGENESSSTLHLTNSNYQGASLKNLCGDADAEAMEIFDDNTERRQVPVRRIDSLFEEHGFQGSGIIKLDVQGYELEALKGAARIIDRFDVVIMETSFFEFRAGSPLFADAVEFMRGHDYEVYDVFGGHNRPLDGARAQADVVFVRKHGRFRETNLWCDVEQGIALGQLKRPEKC